MLSVKTLASSKATSDYFKENYYTSKAPKNSLEPAGVWAGKGAAILGLSGQVQRETFEALLEGHLPKGQRLGVQKEGEWKHRVGWDLTLSAPKSVSILALVGGDKRLIELHNQAVNKTLAEIEKIAAQARVWKEGQTHYEDTGNLVMARFQHATSRENDPQLHTHDVILNMTQRHDGKFRSLASEKDRPKEGAQVKGFLEQVYANKRLWGATYRSHIAYGLPLLGYEIERTSHDCQFEIVGVPSGLIKHFSKRRTHIENRLTEQGESGSKAAERAALEMRPSKTQLNAENEVTRWNKEAEAMGFSAIDFVQKTYGREKSTLPLTEQRTEANAAIHRAIHQLSEREAVFSHQALLSCSMSHALGQVSPERMADTLGAVIQEGNLLPRLLIESGARIPAWTTQRAIDLEKTIIQQFSHAKDSVNPMATREEVQKSLQSSQNKQTLNPEQRAAVELAATTSDRVMGIHGYAGTGKTTLLNAVKELATLQGFQVIGLAPSATAARHLGNETDILNYTEQRFIIDTHLQKKTNEKTLIIIDESSMIANKEMHELLNISEKSGARLLLVGDKLQLPSIGSGKPFALLQEAGLTLAVMKILQRQRNDVLRAVVSATIGGDISTAMQGLAPSTTELPSKEERMDTLVGRYVSMNPEDREKTLLLVPANEDRHTVNQFVHYHLQNQGKIAKQEEEKNVLVTVNLTRAESARANFYQEGYVVRFGQDNKKLNISKEDYLTVTGVNLEKQQLTIQTDKGKMLQWSPRQLETVLGGYVEVYQPQVRAVAVGEQIRWTRNDKAIGNMQWGYLHCHASRKKQYYRYPQQWPDH
jgi:conjugative relaxase-like TrwC/TraI family protein